MRKLLASTAAIALLAGAAMAADQTTTGQSSSQNPSTSRSLSGSTNMSKADVQKSLEQQGYSGISGLQQDKQGQWQGTAKHNGQNIQFKIDNNTGQVMESMAK